MSNLNHNNQTVQIKSKIETIPESIEPPTKTIPQKTTRKINGPSIHCDYCREDITNELRIKCADCKDFDLCIDCFKIGVSVPPHENIHRYRIVEHVITPIFHKDWGADEELLLLEGIEIYGFGNWNDISDHVGTKSQEKCESHYVKTYLESFTSPRPIPINKVVKYKTEGSMGGDVKLNEYPEYPSLMKSKPKRPRLYSRNEIHPSILNASIAGFLPERGDFEIEHENDAELILANLKFNDDDNVYEKELKLKVIQVYNRKLQERNKRKEFLLERGLPEFSNKGKRKYTIEEKEISDNMKPFARFHSKESHEKLLNGLFNEYRLRNRIKRLQSYRVKGFKSMTEINSYESEKIKKTSSRNLRSRNKSEILFEDTKEDIINKNGIQKEESLAKNEEIDIFESDFDISKDEGYNRLTSMEIKLCMKLRLHPNEYFKVKEAIGKEAFIKGMIDKGNEKQLITVDFNKTSDQLSFIIYNGWEKSINKSKKEG